MIEHHASAGGHPNEDEALVDLIVQCMQQY
jgi:hypothetical protein